ncbi:MAG: hypothetical protein ACFFED_05785 [Candidatus Thorarchaeota archaeon]
MQAFLDVILTILVVAIIGIAVFGFIVSFFIDQPAEEPPKDWGPTVLVPYKPSDEKMNSIPDMCPSCGAEISPFSVEWDPESEIAYCPDCRFPIRPR